MKIQAMQGGGRCRGSGSRENKSCGVDNLYIELMTDILRKLIIGEAL